jgi:hypothetical protein
MKIERRKTIGFKPVLLSPETHARLSEITKKCQIYNDVITELLNMNMNVNTIVQTNPQVDRPERSALPSTKKGVTPNG